MNYNYVDSTESSEYMANNPLIDNRGVKVKYEPQHNPE